jgi:SNF family Na+-dependent transporter
VVIVGWAMVYFIYSFFVPLPWVDGTLNGAENFFYNVVLQRSEHLWFVFNEYKS